MFRLVRSSREGLAMKIVHIYLNIFTDEMSYQENLLAKYHVKNGFEVTIITSTWKYELGSKIVEANKRDYINQDGVHVVRLSIKGNNDIHRKFRRFKGVYETLCNEKPDILFIHNCQYIDISVITKYIKKHNIDYVYVDNHADSSNSATNWLSKNILHKIIWRYYAHLIEPYTNIFYGVLPARVDFLTEIYKLPKKKCELLIMGADDELVIRAKECRAHTRKKYSISENDFLIVTGGKIDRWKRQTILLEKAVEEMHMQDVRLVIFGSIDENLRESVKKFCGERITYIGWLSREETYQLIAAADLAVYPGGHSVLWEQTAGQAVPMIVKHWEGTHHIDIGGNTEFLYEDSYKEIQDKLEKLVTSPAKYQSMKSKAESCAELFLYSNIAKNSIK